MAEVARDAELDGVAAALLPLPEAAAGQRGDRREQAEERGEPPHGTATFSANERTRPSFAATSRWLPAGSARRSPPSAAVTPLTPAALTVAP